MYSQGLQECQFHLDHHGHLCPPAEEERRLNDSAQCFSGCPTVGDNDQLTLSPGLPGAPGVPALPGEPGLPGCPDAPGGPGGPGCPAAPGLPASPMGPCGPVSPFGPGWPGSPRVPGSPWKQKTAVDSGDLDCLSATMMAKAAEATVCLRVSLQTHSTTQPCIPCHVTDRCNYACMYVCTCGPGGPAGPSSPCSPVKPSSPSFPAGPDGPGWPCGRRPAPPAVNNRG